MESTFVTIIEIIGTMAFAISGIRLASAKKFDWFGAYVVGLVTAIGGGTLRDVLLDLPAFWMQNSIYLTVTALSLLFVIFFGQYLIRLQNTFFIFDTIGLALFVVVGIQKTLMVGYPFWVAIVMGTITGAFGGIIRDILINEEPLIFRKDIYAMACVIGGIFYWLSYKIGLNDVITQSISAAMVIITRLVAVKYHMSLPALKAEDEYNQSKQKK
ncbi:MULTISPECIES: trimeric intracellular cation channel family protein [Bacteroidales]|uniref:Membrane protein n=1 Tax=Coprobacter secundus subsp. similis TaxID=2751153 RepID=A0A7G1HSD7_9BACT|nr:MULTISPECIES: trimeric intracellular cation channel family protein [Bacteroidales]BCI62400.1 membrane protein [Coprobacter secundus subsp. similis]CCY37830.1 putative uncharacterized protein [Tannerella sp. CAG:118]